jgi:pilin/secretion family protein with methylation motif
MLFFHKRHRARKRRRSRGFTLAEMAVALGIHTLIMSGVASVFWLSARAVKEIYGPARSCASRISALNQIRFRLADASIGSCVFFPGDNYHKIQFDDPNLGTTSEFEFDTVSNILYYDDDTSSADDAVDLLDGPINITFRAGNDGVGVDALVTVFVQTSAALAYSRVDEREGETVVYLRNPMVTP